MKFLKENVGAIMICLFELVVGVLLLINPIGFTSWIIMGAGIIMAIFGAVETVKYFLSGTKNNGTRHSLTKGILLLIFGLFCTLKTEWFIITFPILTVLYGIITLITGVEKIQLTVEMIRRKNNKWPWAAVGALLSVACAVVILTSPFSTTAVLWMFTGITLISEGILDILGMIFGDKASKRNRI